MEGFGTSHSSQTVVTVVNKDISSVDDVARVLLEEFVEVDEVHRKIKLCFKNIIEWESGEICKYFKEGRHLAALKRIIDKQSTIISEYFILAIDEADKCPIPLARFIRDIVTHVQQKGIQNVRFLIAGISPYLQKMAKEDQGIVRFFYKTLNASPLPDDEAIDLIETKLDKVIKEATKEGLNLKCDPQTIERVVQLSGGHPHLLQLLGSHLVEHENQDPDEIIDSRDLVDSLRSICYEDRAWIYDSTIHFLELEGMLEPLKQLFSIATLLFPTRIGRKKAEENFEKDTLSWLVVNDILSPISDDEYRLNDDFLRIRIVMDEEKKAESIERLLISTGSIEDEDSEWPVDDLKDFEEEI